VNDVNLLKNSVTIIRTKRIIFVLLNQKNDSEKNDVKFDGKTTE